MSPNEAFGDAVWVAKNVKRICKGGGGARETFVGEISVARQPCRLENGCGVVDGVTLGPDRAAYISGLFWCGLRELYVGWAHKKSMWLHVLQACLLWIHPGRCAGASLSETVFGGSLPPFRPFSVTTTFLTQDPSFLP